LPVSRVLDVEVKALPARDPMTGEDADLSWSLWFNWGVGQVILINGNVMKNKHVLD
jgi:hypothetical protein